MIETAIRTGIIDADDYHELELEASNACFIYAFLSRAFAKEPDDAFYAMLTSAHTKTVFNLLKQELSWAESVEAALDGMQKASLSVAPADGVEDPRRTVIDQAQQESLKADFTYLFIGPGTLPAPLWESVYITGRNEVLTQETLEVRRLYKANGFSTEQFPFMADDHIAVELAFMASLSKAFLDLLLERKRSDTFAAEGKDSSTSWNAMRDAQFAGIAEIQKRFLDDHLNRWILLFAERMVSQKKTGDFYPSLAAFSAQFCHYHSRNL